jgi:glucose/mannose transport system permease protein
MFIPYQAILIPLFQFLRDVNLYGGIPGLIVIHVVYGLPITTLIFRNFYVEIPDEMLEAASIDGAGFFQIYTETFSRSRFQALSWSLSGSLPKSGMNSCSP